MKQSRLGNRWGWIPLTAIGIAGLIALIGDWPLLGQVHGPLRAIAIATCAVATAIGALAWLSRRDQRSAAAIRLDWFLPQLRRPRGNQPLHSRWAGRSLRALVPASWRSNHHTKQRGRIRRLLRWLGTTWLASPPRRVVQSVCLVLFLVSFFYVLWPYTAAPAPPGQVSSGWQFDQLDQQTGNLQFSKPVAEPWLEQVGMVFVSGGQNLPPTPLSIVDRGGNSITLAAAGEVQLNLLDQVLTSGGSWTLHQTDPAAWPSHYTAELADKEWLPAELFLTIDPLLSLSTAIASRSWVWSLVCAAVILIVCVLIPRGFCGYLCPLGTTIDLFDWLVSSRTDRFRVPDDGWWVHLKYYLLAGTLVAAAGGILVSGFVAAIPVITRAVLFLGEPLQSGTLRGWHLVPAWNVGHFISIGLFAVVLGLGFLRPRFWCKYVCPSGAVFSLGNLFRVTERKVESSCINCNKCVEICPFDAIKPDFTTRTTDCTMCQSCGGVCPTHAIKFVERWNVVELKVANDPPTRETALGRRGFLSLAAGSTAAVVGGVTVAGTTKLLGAGVSDPDGWVPVRPPGSVPEQEFLQMCIRCGECFKACPNNVLQPEAFQQGLEGLWTPQVVADWAGCESSCNACGQVCPTGAIRPLPLEEKKVARMGLAIVNEQTCLPMAGREACDLCVQECNAAGYHAIEYIQVGTEVDDDGIPIDGSGMLAPVVIADQCVGCGLCQTRCYAINVKSKGLLSESAIIVEAGEGKEDRMMSGSYIEQRQQRLQKRQLPVVSQDRPRSSLESVAAPKIDSPAQPTAEFEAVEIQSDENPFGL